MSHLDEETGNEVGIAASTGSKRCFEGAVKSSYMGPVAGTWGAAVMERIVGKLFGARRLWTGLWGSGLRGLAAKGLGALGASGM